MMEQIGEPINVIASFQSGKITPLIFIWKNRRYEHLQPVTMWCDYEGDAKRLFFSVITGANLYELSFHTRRFQWHLVRIQHE